MKKYKVGIIGTGARSIGYGMHYAEHPEIDVVALCDPIAKHRKMMAEESKLENTFAEYGDYREMFAAEKDLDGVIICSPNYLHVEPAVASFERGIPIILEKPLATSMMDCERIVDAEQKYNGRCMLGFVLRSAPGYVKIFDMISNGTIGNLISIQADEFPGLIVSSILNRGSWRRHTNTSGGVILEKCCHDMDVFNWMTDSRPVTLNSFGGRKIFLPNQFLPKTCDECQHEADCLYYKNPKASDREDRDEELMHAFSSSEKDLCMYNLNSDNVDVQSVNIEYANGVIVNFLLNLNCIGPKTARNFHGIGTKGRIWANLDEDEIFHYDNLSGKTHTINITGDGSGHGGGNKSHALQLLRMMKEPDYRPDQNAEAGYLAAAMCFAADLSRIERRRVNFRYGINGKISFN